MRTLKIHSVGLVQASLLFTALPAPAAAQTKGMVVAMNGTVTVFDADTDTVLATIPLLGATINTGDCSITEDLTKGFVTDFSSRVHVIDLTATPPTLASPPNPVPIANFGEDTSITPDGKFVVVCDGSADGPTNPQPVSVVDVATQTQVHTFPLGQSCNSVDVCSDNSVLVTSTFVGRVRRLTIDSLGNLTDTGESLPVFDPNNVFCAPGAQTGVVITRNTDTIISFTIPGLTPVNTRNLSGNFGISGFINAAGDRVYTRDNNNPSNNGFLEYFAYNQTTGALGLVPLVTAVISSIPTFFGIDSMAMHPNGTKLYLSQPARLSIRDPNTLAELSTIPLAAATPTGVCLAPNQPPDCSGATASPSELWPPNHKMAGISIVGVTDPDGDAVTITPTSVTQDEPVQVSDGGSGRTCPDATLSPLQVRKERSGSGDGRVYRIEFTARDEKGATCTGTVTVGVPLEKSGAPAQESPATFDSLVCP